jgi:hypothetical protein
LAPDGRFHALRLQGLRRRFGIQRPVIEIALHEVAPHVAQQGLLGFRTSAARPAASFDSAAEATSAAEHQQDG